LDEELDLMVFAWCPLCNEFTSIDSVEEEIEFLKEHNGTRLVKQVICEDCFSQMNT